MTPRRIHLATGVAVREGRILLVASRYDGRDEPLWTLPGGRQRDGELLRETVERECREETGIAASANGLAYVSESYDPEGTHVLNATFELTLAPGAAVDPAIPSPDAGDHVVAAAWVPLDALPQRLVVAVVREPLLAYLRGYAAARYFGFADAGITIRWPTDAR